jgi:hypothetical protein
MLTAVVAAVGYGILMLLSCPLWGELASETEEHPKPFFSLSYAWACGPPTGMKIVPESDDFRQSAPASWLFATAEAGRFGQGRAFGARSSKRNCNQETLDGFFPPRLDRCLKREHSNKKESGPVPYCCAQLGTSEPGVAGQERNRLTLEMSWLGLGSSSSRRQTVGGESRPVFETLRELFRHTHRYLY